MAAQKFRKARSSTTKAPKPSPSTKKAPVSSESADDLRAGVLALGGDDEDYNLLKDLESDDTQEFDGDEAEVSKHYWMG